MNYGDLKSLIRMRIDDIRQIDYTDQMLYLLINRALQKVYNDFIKNRVYFNISYSTTAISSQATALPTTIQKLLQVQYDDNSGDVIRVVEPELLNKSVNPCFAVLGSNLVFYRTIDTAFNVYLTYVPKVILLDSGVVDIYDLTEIPEPYQDLIVGWVAVLALGKDEDNVEFWSNMYAKEFADAVEIARVHSDDDSVVIDTHNEPWM